MKTLYFLIAILMLSIISCDKDDNIVSNNPVPDNKGISIEEEINSISWGNLCGRAVYMKNDKYVFIDTKDSTVRVIGDVFDFDVKYNYKKDCITGLVEEYYPDTTLNLWSVDFNGNKSRLSQPLEFNTYIYDWFPDGRLAYLNWESKTAYIERTPISLDTTLRYYDIACVPDSNKILILSSFEDSTYINYQITCVDINSGEKSTSLLFLFPSPSPMICYLSSLRYSLITGQILYQFWRHIPGFSPHIPGYVDLYEVPHDLIASSAKYPNWSPLNEGELTYSEDGDTYLMNINNGNEILVIPGGEMITWFK